ncbi:T0123498 isoform 2 [Pan troglodytes]|uniref:T0123498 isoform 2 n=1 Tax=Pan troglodytes TaxID=9598 RepID=A0A2J8KWU7_PANTR|nr:T0123498 isoform 2 [Pan troglodytes]
MAPYCRGTARGKHKALPSPPPLSSPLPSPPFSPFLLFLLLLLLLPGRETQPRARLWGHRSPPPPGPAGRARTRWRREIWTSEHLPEKIKCASPSERWGGWAELQWERRRDAGVKGRDGVSPC